MTDEETKLLTTATLEGNTVKITVTIVEYDPGCAGYYKTKPGFEDMKQNPYTTDVSQTQIVVLKDLSKPGSDRTSATWCLGIVIPEPHNKHQLVYCFGSDNNMVLFSYLSLSSERASFFV